MPNESKKTTTAVVMGDNKKPKPKLRVKKRPLYILIVILLTVAAISMVLVTTQKNDEPKAEKQTSTSYKAQLKKLADEHGALLEQNVAATLSGEEDDKAKEDLQKNAAEISEQLVGPYGEEAQKKFNQALDSYIEQAEAYAKAAQAKNETAKKAAYTKLSAEFVTPAAALLHEKNKELDTTILNSSIGAYVFTMTSLIDGKVSGGQKLPDGQRLSTNLKALGGNLNVTFEYIADSTIKKYPSKYPEEKKQNVIKAPNIK